jgi:hypothetical protein
MISYYIINAYPERYVVPFFGKTRPGLPGRAIISLNIFR